MEFYGDVDRGFWHETLNVVHIMNKKILTKSKNLLEYEWKKRKFYGIINKMSFH